MRQVSFFLWKLFFLWCFFFFSGVLLLGLFFFFFCKKHSHQFYFVHCKLVIKVSRICSKVQSVVKEYWRLVPTAPLLTHEAGRSRADNEGYTTVQTVLRVVSNLTAFASVGFMFVSYMGFSNEACPLVFSWPAYPLYWTFGLVLERRKNKDGKQLRGIRTSFKAKTQMYSFVYIYYNKFQCHFQLWKNNINIRHVR